MWGSWGSTQVDIQISPPLHPSGVPDETVSFFVSLSPLVLLTDAQSLDFTARPLGTEPSEPNLG